MKIYTVVLCCRDSLIRLPSNGGLKIAPLTSKHGNLEMLVVQRVEPVPHISSSIPRELMIEVAGPAPSLESAVALAASCADEYSRQLAFAANAWQGSLNVHLAYDSSPGTTEREFFQNWALDERGLPRTVREVDPGLMYRVLCGIAKLTEKKRNRLMRAVIQYTDALQHWKPGTELYALAHLFMGVEAITPLVIEREVAARGLKNRAELEKQLNGPPPDSLLLRAATWLFRKAGGYTQSRLEPWARRELIFKGDKETFSSAQRASNHFEHGSKHHSEIHSLAADAMMKTAAYLREAMLRSIDIDAMDYAQLTDGLYKTPFGAVGFRRQLFGTLKGSTDQLSAPDQLYPHVTWEFKLLSYVPATNGTADAKMSLKITPRMSSELQLVVHHIAVAGPTPISPTNVEYDVSKAGEVLSTEQGIQLEIDPKAAAEWPALVGSIILNCNSLPHLASFWVGKLDPALWPLATTATLSENIKRITELVKSRADWLPHLEQCEEAWNEALAAHELSAWIGGAYTGEKGLVVPNVPLDGGAAEVSDLAKLRKLNDDAVGLVKRLAAMLDKLPTFKQGGQ